jgi:hypothetical protein
MSTFGNFTVTRASTKNVLGSAGLYVSVADNVPAFEFNADGSYRGLLVEPGATNQIRNNSMTGAVAGAPGTLPTNWVEGLSGLTREVIAIGTELGVNYIDIKLSGTASGTSAAINFESATQIVAANGEVWTNSAWLRTVAVSNPPLSYRLGVNERTSIGGFVVNGDSSALSLTSTLTRFSFTRTLAGGGTVARVQSYVTFFLTNGATYDFTIRIGWPQMELGAVATSPIVTTGSTASRVADAVSLTGASSLIGQSEGTIYIEHQPILSTGTVSRRVITLSDNTTTNRVRLEYQSFGSPLRYRLVSTVTQGGSATYDLAEGNAGGLTTGNVEKLALGYKNADYATYRNGVAVVGTDTGTGTLTSIASSEIDLGQVQDNTLQLNGWIRSVALFPTRLADATLASLTA